MKTKRVYEKHCNINNNPNVKHSFTPLDVKVRAEAICRFKVLSFLFMCQHSQLLMLFYCESLKHEELWAFPRDML